jgi:hypothetical protein
LVKKPVPPVKTLTTPNVDWDCAVLIRFSCAKGPLNAVVAVIVGAAIDVSAVRLVPRPDVNIRFVNRPVAAVSRLSTVRFVVSKFGMLNVVAGPIAKVPVIKRLVTMPVIAENVLAERKSNAPDAPEIPVEDSELNTGFGGMMPVGPVTPVAPVRLAPVLPVIEIPEGPVLPMIPVGPVTPVKLAPVAPVMEIPEGPVAPVLPVFVEKPFGPVAPVDPVGPKLPVFPVAPVDPELVPPPEKPNCGYSDAMVLYVPAMVSRFVRCGNR